jgi:hypothetical protein
MALGQMDAVVGNGHHRNNMREEFYPGRFFAENLLHQAFLCFALVSRLFFFGLFELFHQVTMPVAMQPGFVPVLAKLSNNVIPVEIEAGVHKEARKAAAYNAENKQHGCEPVLHATKVTRQRLFARANVTFSSQDSKEPSPTMAKVLYIS